MYSRNKILNKVTDICISLYEISLSFKDEIKTMNKFKEDRKNTSAQKSNDKSYVSIIPNEG